MTTATDQVDVGTRRRSITLAEAWSVFWRNPSPTFLATLLAGSVGARLAVGDWNAWDLWVPLLMIGFFPFQEWLTHVILLHWKPVRIGRFTLDPWVARKHREHHADPRNVPLIFIPLKTLLVVFPMTLFVALVVFPTLGRGLTYLATAAATGLVYEWTHYLIHSEYRPRSSAYRAIWRNHRLHHYKNEKYWFTVTTANTADVVLGTNPDPTTVDRSPTARNLLGT
ncbi:MAG TPA: sterol desaturase family protein [Nitriliruptorales bacterium]|jgi:hypothetical protein